MQETRRARLQSVILEELSVVVPREVKDPRIPSVTFTKAEVTSDGSQATVYLMILGGSQGGTEGLPPLSDNAAKQRMKDCLDGLNSASGFLRRHLAKILTIKHIPALIFKEDKGFENTMRVHELLKQINSEGSGTPSGEGSGSENS